MIQCAILNFRGIQNKKPFEIILHVGRVTSLRSWVAKKSCHGQTLLNECSISDYHSNFEVIFSFLIKKSRQKAIEIEIAFFFSFPWESQGWHIVSFLLRFTYPS